MAGLLYFVSGSTVKPRPEELAALGLQFDHPPTLAECIGRGPSGKPGVVVADPHRVERIGIYLDDQHWEAVPVLEGEPRLYIGWYRNAKPGPADLARKSQVAGPRVLLADGNEWMVPLVQDWSEEDAARAIALPRAVKRAADGKWVKGDVEPTYQALWEAAQEYWQVLCSAVEDGSMQYEWEPLFDYACALLAVNYSLTPLDVSALTLFTTDNVAQRVTNAAVDWLTFVEWLEKKSAAEAAGPDLLPGAADSPPATAQLLPT